MLWSFLRFLTEQFIEVERSLGKLWEPCGLLYPCYSRAEPIEEWVDGCSVLQHLFSSSWSRYFIAVLHTRLSMYMDSNTHQLLRELSCHDMSSSPSLSNIKTIM